MSFHHRTSLPGVLVALSTLLAFEACSEASGGTDGETHFVCKKDEDCPQSVADRFCVQGTCLSLSNSTPPDASPAQRGDASAVSENGDSLVLPLDSSVPSDCTEVSVNAEYRPHAVFVLVDRSGSMATSDGNTSIWDRTLAGLGLTFADPWLDASEVSLGYYPATDTCSGTVLNPPLTTPIAPLEGRDRLNASLSSAGPPAGSAFLLPTLQAAYDAAKGWKAATPGGVAEVLVVNHDPLDCPGFGDSQLDLLLHDEEQHNQILTTFVHIGTPRGFEPLLDDGRPYYWVDEDFAPAELAEAMRAQAAAGSGCLHTEIDNPRNVVRVVLVAGGNERLNLSRVQSAEQCSSNLDGYYLTQGDGGTTTVNLCPYTCEKRAGLRVTTCPPR